MMNKSKLKTFFIFCLLQSLLVSAKAQILNANFSTDTILIGDIFSLTLDVSSINLEDKVFFPTISDTLGKFEILETYEPDTNSKSVSKTWDMSLYEPGIFQVNEFAALVQRKNGKVDTLKSFEPIIMYVKTLAIDTTQDFKDIKLSKNIAYPWKELIKKWSIPIGVGLLALIGIIAYFYFRKKNKEEKIVVKTPLDYHQEALKKLKSLEGQKLWQKNEIKTYYLEISEILRTYLEGRYTLNAMESTTDEIIHELNEKEINKGINHKLANVLQQCDLAKFAKFKPSPEENTRLMKLAQDFVIHTKPKPIVEETKTEN